MLCAEGRKTRASLEEVEGAENGAAPAGGAYISITRLGGACQVPGTVVGLGKPREDPVVVPALTELTV